ncbi:MAG: hypothetical protein ACW98K_00335 [Candidatus Kariarchaeaceae archaeon]
MNTGRILNILFFTTILLMIPSFTVEETIDVFPESRVERVYNLRSPIIKLDTKISSYIFLNISYIDPITKEISKISKDLGFQESIEIDIKKPGIYKIELLSFEVGKIEMNGIGGIHPNIVLIVLIIAIIRAAIFVNEHFLFYEI